MAFTRDQKERISRSFNHMVEMFTVTKPQDLKQIKTILNMIVDNNWYVIAIDVKHYEVAIAIKTYFDQLKEINKENNDEFIRSIKLIFREINKEIDKNIKNVPSFYQYLNNKNRKIKLDEKQISNSFQWIMMQAFCDSLALDNGDYFSRLKGMTDDEFKSFLGHPLVQNFVKNLIIKKNDKSRLSASFNIKKFIEFGFEDSLNIISFLNKENRIELYKEGSLSLDVFIKLPTNLWEAYLQVVRHPLISDFLERKKIYQTYFQAEDMVALVEIFNDPSIRILFENKKISLNSISTLMDQQSNQALALLVNRSQIQEAIELTKSKSFSVLNAAINKKSENPWRLIFSEAEIKDKTWKFLFLLLKQIGMNETSSFLNMLIASPFLRSLEKGQITLDSIMGYLEAGNINGFNHIIKIDQKLARYLFKIRENDFNKKYDKGYDKGSYFLQKVLLYQENDEASNPFEIAVKEVALILKKKPIDDLTELALNISEYLETGDLNHFQKLVKINANIARSLFEMREKNPNKKASNNVHFLQQILLYEEGVTPFGHFAEDVKEVVTALKRDPRISKDERFDLCNRFLTKGNFSCFSKLLEVDKKITRKLFMIREKDPKYDDQAAEFLKQVLIYQEGDKPSGRWGDAVKRVSTIIFEKSKGYLSDTLQNDIMNYLILGSLCDLRKIINYDENLARELFLVRGKDFYKKDKLGNIFSHHVLLEGEDDPVLFKFILKEVDLSSINDINQKGQSVLELAAQLNLKKVAVMLIENGAEIRYLSFLKTASKAEDLATDPGTKAAIKQTILDRQAKEFEKNQEEHWKKQEEVMMTEEEIMKKYSKK